MKQMISKLWSKYANREVISYLICGVLTTLINYVVDNVAYYMLGLNASVSNLIAWILSVLFAFFANKIWVFQSKVWSGKAFVNELIGFIIARVASLGFETAFLFVTVDKFNLLKNWIAKIASNVFVVIMNYFASKFLIFKNKKEEKENVK